MSTSDELISAHIVKCNSIAKTTVRHLSSVSLPNQGCTDNVLTKPASESFHGSCIVYTGILQGFDYRQFEGAKLATIFCAQDSKSHWKPNDLGHCGRSFLCLLGGPSVRFSRTYMSILTGSVVLWGMRHAAKVNTWSFECLKCDVRKVGLH